MLPKHQTIPSRLGRLSLPLLFSLLAALPALAQTAVRGPIALPEPKALAAPAPAPTAAADQQNAAAKTEEPQPKFPNKDTAKNRKDYDMGTDTGTIQLGRDEATGDTVMRHNPPKKTQEPSQLEQMPIQIYPQIGPRHR